MAGVHVVTGASRGIGREIARGLAATGATVVLACRDEARAESARRIIGSAAEILLVDLSSQASIRRAASELLKCHETIDVLVNNAAVAPHRRLESHEGIELTWATNVLGYFLFTELVLPALRRASAARIINVASLMAYDLDLDDVEFTARRYSAASAYAQSKQADRMLTWALADRMAGSAVTANALHPGSVDTRLLHALAPGAHGISAAQGADTAVWLATSADVGNANGRFYAKRQEISCEFRGPDTETLWARCHDMTRS